jgi:hypothetical protein
VLIDPDTVIQSTDFVIFVSAKSMPSCRQPSFREKDYEAEAEAYLEVSGSLIQAWVQHDSVLILSVVVGYRFRVREHGLKLKLIYLQ